MVQTLLLKTPLDKKLTSSPVVDPKLGYPCMELISTKDAYVEG